MKKRILSMILALVMLIGLVPEMGISVSAEGTSYDLWVGGAQFTGTNLVIDGEDVTGITGSATFNPETNTLTLDNFSCSSNAFGGVIHVNSGDITIKLKGHNTLTGTGEDTYGIYTNGNLAICNGEDGVAQGQLTINTVSACINAPLGTLEITDVKVTATSVENHGLSAARISLSGVTLSATGGGEPIHTDSVYLMDPETRLPVFDPETGEPVWVYGAINIENSTVEAYCTDTVWGNYAFESAPNISGTFDVYAGEAKPGSYVDTPTAETYTTSKYVKIVSVYPVWVGGEQFTSEKLSIEGDSGTATYDPESKTLTLNGFEYNGNGYRVPASDFGAVIYCNGNLNLKLTGVSSITYDNSSETVVAPAGVYVEGDLTVTDDSDGSLNATADAVGLISGFGDITIFGGTIEVSNSHYGIASEGNIVIAGENTFVNATSIGDGGSGIIAYGDITISGGTVEATANAESGIGINAIGGNITISGGTVTASGHESGIYGDSITIEAGATVIAEYTTTGDDYYGAFAETPTLNGTFIVYAGTADANEPADASEDATYANKYVKIVPAYTVTYMVGEDEVYTEKVEHGKDVANVPEVSAKEGYTAAWSADGKNITADTPINAVYTPNQYTITFDTDGGSEIAAITQDYNTAVTAPADPTKTGYTFAGWDAEIPATMPAKNVTFTAQWTAKQYTITQSTETVNGTLIFQDKNNAFETVTVASRGDHIAIFWESAEGYELVGNITAQTEEGEPVEVEYKDYMYSFVMPAENVIVSATFEKINYMISVAVSEGGTAATDKETANFGDTVTIDATPAAGYVLGSVTVTPVSNEPMPCSVDGEDAPTEIAVTNKGDGKYSFTMPASDVAVNVNFERAMHIRVNLPSGEQITLEVELTDRVEEVKEKIADQIDVAPENLRLWFAEKQMEDGNTLQDYSIQKGSVITVEEVIQTYDVWVGGVEVTSKNTSGEGWSYVRATKTLTLNNAAITGSYNNANIYASENLNIVLEGSNSLASANQGIKVDGANTLTISGTGTLTIQGHWDGIKVENGSVVITDANITSIAEHSYGVQAAKLTIDNSVVTIEGGVNAEALTCSDVTFGSNCHVKITSKGNAAFSTVPVTADGWYRNNAENGFGNEMVSQTGYFEYLGKNHVTLTDKQDDANHTVSCAHGVSFEEAHQYVEGSCVCGAKKTYTITFNTNGGEISEDEVISDYTYGVGATLPIPTREGYTFLGWYADEEYLGEAVTAIGATDTGDKTFYAHWTTATYGVTVNANPTEGGTVTGLAAGGTYDHGDTVTLTASPKIGYKFVNWTEGGNVVSEEATFVFAATENRNLTANFRHEHKLCQTNGCTDVHADVPFTGVSSLSALRDAAATGGNYYLTDNIYVDGTITVAEGKTLNLCLNGKKLSYTGTGAVSIFTVEKGATLNITDCGTDTREGHIDSATKLWTEGTGDEGETAYNLTGGVITGGTGMSTDTWQTAHAGAIMNYGTVYIYGGNIAGNQAIDPNGGNGGAIFNATGSDLYVYGGSIVGNYADKSIIYNYKENNVVFTGNAVFAYNTLTKQYDLISSNSGYGSMEISGNASFSHNYGGTVVSACYEPMIVKGSASFTDNQVNKVISYHYDELVEGKDFRMDGSILMERNTKPGDGSLATDIYVYYNSNFMPDAMIVMTAPLTESYRVAFPWYLNRCVLAKGDGVNVVALGETDAEKFTDVDGRPIAAANDVVYAGCVILDQPTAGNNYTVTATGEPSYQWYVITKEDYAVTDETVDWHLDNYDSATGKWSGVSYFGAYCYFDTILYAGDVITLTFDDAAEGSVEFWDYDAFISYPLTPGENNTYTFTAPSTAIYSLEISSGNSVNPMALDEDDEESTTAPALTASVYGTVPKLLAEQDDVQLDISELVSGTYFCKVTWPADQPYVLSSEYVDYHAHSYSYTASENVITEKCTCGHEATATLTAPTGNLTYDGVEKKATVAYSDGWQGGDLTVTHINNINVGTASASVEKDGKTAVVTFGITKADQTAPTGLGKTNETAAGKMDGTITGVTANMEYRKDGESSYSAINATSLSGLAAGKYFVRVKGDVNRNPSPEVEVTIAAGKKLVVTYKADGKVVGTVEVEYGKDATAPEIPAKEGYNETAPKWDKDGKNITADTVINAVYTKNQPGEYADVTPETNEGGGKVTEGIEELKEKVPFTPEEKLQIEYGADVEVWLEIKDISDSVSAEDKVKIAEKLGDADVALYLDIAMFKQVGENEASRLTQLSDKVQITFKLDDSYINTDKDVTRTYSIIHIHDGKAEVITPVFDANAKTLSFRTDRFSTYALVYTDVVNVPPTEKPTTHPAETPATGDSFQPVFWIACMTLSIIGIAVLLLDAKRRHAR